MLLGQIFPAHSIPYKDKRLPSKADAQACPSFRRKIWLPYGSFSLSPLKLSVKGLLIFPISLSKEGGLQAKASPLSDLEEEHQCVGGVKINIHPGGSETSSGPHFRRAR